MADKQNGWGVGRKAAGSSPHTQHIWNYINEHPGCTRDEVKAAALDQAWIPTGHANRWYAKHSSKAKTYGQSKDVPLANKQLAVVTHTLHGMLRSGSIEGSPAGYWAKRRPKAPQTGAPESTWTMGRDEIVASVKQTELLQALRDVSPQHIRDHSSSRLTRKQMLALAEWLDAVRVRRID